MKVTCQADAVDGKLTVRVYTDLNSGANDESFGIDNVVVSKVMPFTTIKSSFKDPTNFEGWNCGKITTCGKFGNICGGFNTKAKSHDITKTFTVPAGTYSVSLDFIKIDSWLVWSVLWVVRRG